MVGVINLEQKHFVTTHKLFVRGQAIQFQITQMNVCALCYCRNDVCRVVIQRLTFKRPKTAVDMKVQLGLCKWTLVGYMTS